MKNILLFRAFTLSGTLSSWCSGYPKTRPKKNQCALLRYSISAIKLSDERKKRILRSVGITRRMPVNLEQCTVVGVDDAKIKLARTK